MVNSLGFLLASEIPDLILEKPETQTHELMQRKTEKPNKSLLSLAKGSGMVQPSTTENFETARLHSFQPRLNQHQQKAKWGA